MNNPGLVGTLREISPRGKARIAGLFYLLTIAFAAVGSSIENRLINLGDAGATASNILAHGALLRTGWAAYLVEMACNIAVTALLYDLLKPVNRSVSRLAVYFALVAIIIKTMSRSFLIAPFFLLGQGVPHSAPTAFPTTAFLARLVTNVAEIHSRQKSQILDLPD